jgi:ubiquinone/menaquinone biosynthesis C-methylase UbiE
MPGTDTRFEGDIPIAYDRDLGPLLYEPYADDLARRLPLGPGARVLEIACGTGILTRHLRALLPPDGSLIATDLSEQMLVHGRRKLGTAPGKSGMTWRQADAAALPFHADSFDVVVCQFGLMFVPDKARAVTEARRVLHPGGLFAFNVWGPLETNPVGRIADETMIAFFPDDPPGFYRLPFSYARQEEIESLLRASRFTDVTCERPRLPLRSRSARHAARGMVTGSPAATGIRERGGDPERVIDVMTARLASEGGDAPLELTSEALVFTGRAA